MDTTQERRDYDYKRTMYVDMSSEYWKVQLLEAFRVTGFAILKNHGIDSKKIRQVYRNWHNYFQLPQANKDAHKFHPSTQTGYFPMKTEKAKDASVADLKEFFHLYRDTRLDRYGMFESGKETKELFRNLYDLGKRLLGGLEEVMPINVALRYGTPLQEMLGPNDKTLFRILHYPPILENAEGAVRSAPHEDINLITLLPAASAPGLQVKDRNGRWIALETGEDDIVVNVGDMLQEATGHFLISTTHQVVNPSGEASKESRYSMPLFVHPRSEVRLSPKYTAEEYLTKRLKEIGLI